MTKTDKRERSQRDVFSKVHLLCVLTPPWQVLSVIDAQVTQSPVRFSFPTPDSVVPILSYV